MTGFQTLRPSKPLDIDYRGDTERVCHKTAKICKTIPFKRLASALNY